MDFKNTTAHASYTPFSVGSEADNYKLNVDNFQGKFRIVSLELK